MSQKEMILDHLIDGKSITPLESLELFGVMRLSGRILELRKEGYNIRTEYEEANGKKYARYFLNRRVPTDLFEGAA